MNDTPNMNVAVYTRVSTEDQAKEGYSLDAQLDKLRHYCKARDWNIVGEYVDPGYSGRNTKRPQYQRMFEDIDKWDGILVMKMDRIHRNRLNFIEMMDQLKKEGKEFVSMSETLDTSTAMGRFVMGIIQDIAQLESEEIGERTFIAMGQKAKNLNSGFMGHEVPFGYRKDDDGIFTEIPKEIQLVKKTFQLYSQGNLSMIQIAKKLDLKLATIRYWLRNTWYAGFEQWLNHFKKAPIDPIVSIDLWNRVQLAKVSKPCGPAKHKPFLIKEGVESFDLTPEEMEEMCVYKKRPKHELNY